VIISNIITQETRKTHLPSGIHRC